MDHGSFGSVLLALTVILAAAKLFGDLAQRLRQPAVLGELLAGVVMGNLVLVGFHGLEFVAHDPLIDALAQLGVIVLLFEVGLESTVAQMAKVGLTATLVAILGVVAPFALGFGVGAWLLPDHSTYVHLFLGATLTATSVGITARVLQELGKSQTPEARVILGAAVIDDVLGLVILAAVSGLIVAADRGAEPELGTIGVIIGKALAFLFGSVALGVTLAPWLYRQAAHLRGGGVLLGVSLAFCFFLSWLAAWVGLAPIVGAFAAGLILEGAHYKPFVERGERPLEELIHPIGHLLAPVFFVLMGFRVDLSAFADVGVLGLAAVLTLAAIVGKQVCMLGVGKGIRRLPVGIGMVPRGEVGLIFANIGLTLTLGGEPMIDESTFAAVVIMVIVTTLVTPPALAWALRR
ncbi:MAG: cation:proton antiporter [Myxococcota bacterium]